MMSSSLRPQGSEPFSVIPPVHGPGNMNRKPGTGRSLLVVQIEHARFRVALGQKRPSFAFADQLLQLAILRLQIAKDSGVGGTRDYARWLQPLVHTMCAQSAFRHRALFELGKFDGFVRTQAIGAVPMFEQPLLHEVAVHVGTCDRTGAAADALLALHHDQAVVANPGSS